MSDDAVIILNSDAVAKALANYPELAATEFAKASEESLYSMVGDVADYPDRAFSTYNRTGTLGREWGVAQPEFQSTRHGFEGSLTNNTPYGVYVQGNSEGNDQAAVHSGVWQTANNLLKAAKGRIEGYFTSAAKRIEAAINKVSR